MVNIAPTTDSIHEIPAVLRQRRQWVLWRQEPRSRGEKPTKVPYTTTGRRASSTNSVTWSSFDEVWARFQRGGYSGIGFVFTAHDEFCGIDLDKSLDDHGQPLPWAAEIIAKLSSYTERSPSGTGVKIWVIGKLPACVTHTVKYGTGQVELYDVKRFFTVTGARWQTTPGTVESRHAELEWLVDLLRPTSARPQRAVPTSTLDDDIPTAIEAIENLSAARADEYNRWLGVGMAAYTVSGGPEMLAAWDRFSRRSPKYVEGEPGRKWRTFSGNGGKSQIGELIAWAKQDSGWRPSARRPQSSEVSVVTVDDADEEPVEDHSTPWPDSLAEDAHHGLGGQIVRAIEPHTEADSAALLMQFLVAYGNVVGRQNYFVADGAQHYPNLFAVLIGETAKGRKGTSWAQIHRLFKTVIPSWADERVVDGLSSGEGLIWAVRDPIHKREPIKQKGVVVDYQDVEVDAGVADKRLLVQEGEFAQCLKVIQREGNTLSPVIRRAWDNGKLQILTKNAPAVATGAHVSIIGHITKDELVRLLDATESANGFANRFLWLCVRRSKCLPEGGSIHTVDFSEIARNLAGAVEYGQEQHLMMRDEPAREVWATVYPELSSGRPGLLGAVTTRAEAQVMRLAMIYALLDRSPWIKVEHLRAALAVWEYVEASARYAFGWSLGDRVADEILAALKSAPTGMTRTDIRKLFQGHRDSDQIARALGVLLRHNLAWRETKPTGGRPEERWFAVAGGALKAT